MHISSRLPSPAGPYAALRNPDARNASGKLPFEVVQARAESAEDRRRMEESAARHADAIASFASHGLTMKQGSFTSLYKQELAQSIDGDGDGNIGVEELATGLGEGASLERAGRLHALLDIDGDGRLGLEEFGDSVRDPFRDAGFRRQLEQRGAMDPAAIGALYRNQAAQYDAATVLGRLARAIDTAA
ncbi:EF-hand domain-containing protein [Telluria beijingensis]|uniref:EF-hand domain-containing protein n=1 Tax=Telluria beijingensis TaxID=3068633 RepID=UPI002795D506|nr:EF-hand domain-containing protein [Massilia sp. REN29]